ncbi:hypothetical protein STRAU_5895 [Streptomyces aurantiacus JA 4570]|uniref:Uncharacterized protein n=1 Tax=Streptomyces aurantiacus JA 4570 TaxID=1286094 RepID=S3ZBF9_9ACTN|nr:hypothetical protein STRAU_5895 [Streptomyces aurantiacus JA 4570]
MVADPAVNAAITPITGTDVTSGTRGNTRAAGFEYTDGNLSLE